MESGESQPKNPRKGSGATWTTRWLLQSPDQDTRIYTRNVFDLQTNVLGGPWCSHVPVQILVRSSLTTAARTAVRR